MTFASSNAAQVADGTPSGVMVLDCRLVRRFKDRFEISCRLKDCEQRIAVAQVHIGLRSCGF